MNGRFRSRICHAVLITLFLVLVSVVLAAPSMVSLGAAHAADPPKIAPALLAQMQEQPLQRQPVIVQMKPSPTQTGPDLARQALALLQAHGQAFGSLAIVGGAAGYANAAEINAISLLAQVDSVSLDAPVGPRRPTGTGRVRSNQMTSLYPREVNADRAWQ